MSRFFHAHVDGVDFIVGPGTYEPARKAHQGYPPEGETLDYAHIYLAVDMARQVPLEDFLSPGVVRNIEEAVMASCHD